MTCNCKPGEWAPDHDEDGSPCLELADGTRCCVRTILRYRALYGELPTTLLKIEDLQRFKRS